MSTWGVVIDYTRACAFQSSFGLASVTCADQTSAHVEETRVPWRISEVRVLCLKMAKGIGAVGYIELKKKKKHLALGQCQMYATRHQIPFFETFLCLFAFFVLFFVFNGFLRHGNRRYLC